MLTNRKDGWFTIQEIEVCEITAFPYLKMEGEIEKEEEEEKQQEGSGGGRREHRR